MYGGRYMKRYEGRELNAKINTFLNKKFEKYPELVTPRPSGSVISKPGLANRMMQSLAT